MVELKTTCDRCVSAKVKCDGIDPCAKCVAKGVSCFYRPRKLRESASVSRTVPIVTQVGYGQTEKGYAPECNLAYKEKRSFAVFFTLFKHYNVSCSVYWFSRQLQKIRNFLTAHQKTQVLHRLDSWMETINLKPDEMNSRIAHCNEKMAHWGKDLRQDGIFRGNEFKDHSKAVVNIASPMFLQVKGQLIEDSCSSVIRESFMGDPDNLLPTLTCEIDFGVYKALPMVVSNKAFEDFFGLSAEFLIQDLNEIGGGILPWGGDVMAQILHHESDLLAWIQLLAIKFNALGFPTSFPIERQIPSCNVFKVNWKQTDSQGPVACIIKSFHHEIMDDISTKLSVTFKFEAIGQQSIKRDSFHLFESVDLPETKRAKTEGDEIIDDEWLDLLFDWTEPAPSNAFLQPRIPDLLEKEP